MRTQLYLDRCSENFWSKNLLEEISKPFSKVRSIIEVNGGVKLSSLSAQCKFLAITSVISGSTFLYVAFLEEKKLSLIKEFSISCCSLCFIPCIENKLFFALESGLCYIIDVESNKCYELEGHSSPALGVSCPPRSTIMLTWCSHDVLLWSWPSCNYRSKLKVGEDSSIIWSSFIRESNLLAVAFDCGSIFLWNRSQNMEETVIQPPTGIDMAFSCYSISSDNKWLVGGGSKALMIVYNLTTFKVTQVVKLTESFNSLQYIHFIPCIHPKFQETILVASSDGTTMISDFKNTQKIKSLKSTQYKIDDVCLSNNGLLLSVVYGNGSLKVYTLLSFFPPLPKVITPSLDEELEVDFSVMKENNEVENKRDFKSQEEESMNNLLDRTKWFSILEEYDEYPEKYRKIIWSSILKLPRNFSLVNSLLDKKTNKDVSLFNLTDLSLHVSVRGSLTSVLSCLLYWCSDLSRISFLPEFILPFVKFYHPNLLLCFEASATLIINWGKLIFNSWPSPPTKIFNLIEDIICRDHPDLLAHIKKMHVSIADCTLDILFSSYSKVLSNEDWPKIWDNILSKDPIFIFFVLASFVIQCKQTFITCSTADQIKKLCREECWISSKMLLKKARSLFTNYKMKNDAISEFVGITEGGLPFFELHCQEDQLFRDKTTDSLCSPMQNVAKVFAALDVPAYNSVSGLSREELKKKELECLNRISKLRMKQADRYLLD